MATNLAAATGAFLHYAERRGLDRARVLSAAGVDANAFDRDGARIACDADTAVWEEVERQLDDADLGLHVAESWEAEAFGVAGLAAMMSATVGDAITQSARFDRVIKDDVQLQLVPVGRTLVVAPELPRGHRPWSRAIADSWLATYVVLARRWTGEAVRVLEARFTHPAPRDTSAYERVLGGPVYFGQPTTAVVLGRDVCELPLRTAKADAATYLESLARSALDELRQVDPVSDVRDAVRAAIREGDAHMTRIARHLGTSTRTLQRHLAERRFAFRQLVDDTRCAMALPLVALTDIPIEEIGARLGYSEGKAFRRAFRRWTGLAPHDARSLRVCR